MHQPHLPGMAPSPADTIVNVASVKHRSPFRYPGGKTWLIPRIFQWLGSLTARPDLLVEPFAGGAIVGLTAAFDRLADHVLLVEIDEQVAGVWETIINQGEGAWLAQQVGAFELTVEAVDHLLAQSNLPLRMRALQTIVKNRVNHGGILAEGSGRIKLGESGRGIRSRWYPATLQKRILHIDTIRARLSFRQEDGLHVMSELANREDVVFFIDPPYTASDKKPGRRLYNHWQIDHQRLFNLADQLKGDFLMTYDNTEEVRALVEQYAFDSEAVAMKNTHHAKLTELLIGKNLDWVRA